MSTTTRSPSVNGQGPGKGEQKGAGDRSPGSLLTRALRGVTSQIETRIPRADLDERDPDYIREQLPLMWLAASIWYRGEVRGLGNIPDDGPVLLVGNHSGGNM